MISDRGIYVALSIVNMKFVSDDQIQNLIKNDATFRDALDRAILQDYLVISYARNRHGIVDGQYGITSEGVEFMALYDNPKFEVTSPFDRIEEPVETLMIFDNEVAF